MLEMPTSDRPVTVVEGDCLEMVPALLAAGVAAVVSDPPYGMNWNTDSTRFTGGNRAATRGDGRDNWGAVRNDAVPFDPRPWIEFPKVVLFGANHYAARLPVGTTLVWVKKADHLFGTFLSDAEIAWMKGGHGVYCFRKQFPPPSRMAESGDGRCAHPTQKPVDLMRWCIRRLKLPHGSLILDPFAGSGTTGEAAKIMGKRAVLIEREERYCEVAARRLAQDVLPLDCPNR